MYDRENPCISKGVVFRSAVDCRNAVSSFSIKSETEFLSLKSDVTRFTVKCANEGCKWRLHASLMSKSTLFRIKVNPYQHTCPSVNRSQRLRASKRRWIADASISWIRANPGIGSKEIQARLLEKYGVDVPYDKCYHAKGCKQSVDPAFGEDEHRGADNTDDHPTANEPAEAEIQEEEEDEKAPDVQ
ncbi:hypothetical protein D1007_05520 [Hordeum vulgare]|nr:hypothetical protein D1007_05520 [Hordeum vulgare]